MQAQMPPPLFTLRAKLLASACALAALSLAEADGAEFFAGSFSFSDELGGFRIVAVTGEGTVRDPVVIVEEIEEAAPVTLVIRRHFDINDPLRPGYAPLVVEKVVLNRSVRVWAGFELELQERLRQPSVYGDGLSFNQFGAQPPDVTADAFANHERLYEPYDRIRFSNGHVDPDAEVRFRFIITDPTPLLEFYLVQDPKLLSASLPSSRSFARLD
jgi:hypothetical protein